MARVTVEDCVLMVPNRFDLVMLAAQRARDVSAGASLTIERDNDKTPVIALREIADMTIDLDGLGNSLVRGLQKQVEADEPDEEDLLDFDMPSPGAEEGPAAGDQGAILGAVESEVESETGSVTGEDLVADDTTASPLETPAPDVTEDTPDVSEDAPDAPDAPDAAEDTPEKNTPSPDAPDEEI